MYCNPNESCMGREKQIEDSFIRKLTEQLKYVYRDDIHDRDALVANFRQKFETLNRVKLSDSEFDRLLEEIINPNVFASSKRLRERNTFIREDGKPLQYTLVNIDIASELKQQLSDEQTEVFSWVTKYNRKGDF